MNCKHCGAPLKPDENVCPYCGASVVSESAANNVKKNSEPLAKMKYVSGALVILLSCITFGIYPIYWLCSRKNALNNLTPDEKISDGLFWSCIILYAATIVLIVIDSNIYGITNFISWIVWLFLVFNIRKILRAYASRHIDKATALMLVAPSGVLLFFFGTIYLQFQINKMIKAELLAPEV